MSPALTPGQIILAHRFFLRLRVGDIVIIQHRGLEKIKRIAELPPDGVVVYGDNEAESTDSRQFGVIPKELVIAKLVFPKGKHQF